MARRKTYKSSSTQGKVEVEVRYEQTMEYPIVKATWWQSLDDVNTLYFREINQARKYLEPVGKLLGEVPAEIVTVLSEAGYTYPDAARDH